MRDIRPGAHNRVEKAGLRGDAINGTPVLVKSVCPLQMLRFYSGALG